jgi:ribosomal protein L3 glutamine methyltransferase
MTGDPASELVTVRDFLRFATSRFEAAELAYGHGTDNAYDEAAFIVLEGLHLPIDRLEPFLDARLLMEERQRLAFLIRERVSTRKPAAYLLNKAYMHGLPFYVDERVIVPRSFIGEILFSESAAEMLPALADPAGVARVLDLCTGSGCLAVLAAKLFQNAEVDAVDLSPDALAVARINVEASGEADRLELFEGDLFDALPGERYDLILTNPPYVDAAAMARLPPEYRHEPAMALGSGVDGLDIVRRILAEAGDHLEAGGGLLCEIGTGRDILEAEYPEFEFLWFDTEGSSGEVFWLDADALSR